MSRNRSPDRSRSPQKDTGRFLWVKVRSGIQAREIDITGLRNVDALKQAVKKSVEPKLDALSVSDLQLYQNDEMTEAPLEPDMLLNDITGATTARSALYVHYDEPRTPAQAGDKPKYICGFLFEFKCK